MNKYNHDLSKNLLGLNHKKGYMQKNVYMGLVTGPLTKSAFESGIEGGANK